MSPKPPDSTLCNYMNAFVRIRRKASSRERADFHPVVTMSVQMLVQFQKPDVAGRLLIALYKKGKWSGKMRKPDGGLSIMDEHRPEFLYEVLEGK